MFAKLGGGRHSHPHIWRWRYHSGHTYPITLGVLRVGAGWSLRPIKASSDLAVDQLAGGLGG
jgi:hypothetical protein